MQMQKRKLKDIIVVILLFFSGLGKLAAQESNPLMIQYKNFQCLGKFSGLPAVPKGYTALELTQQSADLALKSVSDYLLRKATADNDVKKIVFGFERYFVQMARIKNHEETLILFNAYKETWSAGGPSKSWVTVAGGGVDFWGGTMNENSGKITFFFNDPF